ncbi:MAG: type IV pilus secretin PilQ [Thermodesulfobacteriota bacterium]|nr:type IV pilus secretin PilQ [Thermodesulfobacteriota bacterium]
MKSFQVVKGISLIVILLFMSSCATGSDVIKTTPITVPAPSGNLSAIQQISFTEGENYTRIHIEGSETIAPPFYKLSQEPLRIVMDVPNIDLKQVKNSVKIDNSTISEIFTTQYDDKGRIEIGLLQMTNYNISREDRSLFVDVEKVKKIVELKEVKKDEVIDKGKEIEIPPPELKKEEPPVITPSDKTSVSEKINKAKEIIDFSLEEKKDYIAFNILADGKLENYNSFKLDGPPRLVLDIWDVSTQNPKKSIKISNPFIKEVRIGQHDNKLRLVFDSSKPQLPAYQINRVDSKLVVSLGNVPQASEPQILLQEKGAEKLSAPRVKVAATPSSTVEEKATAAPEPPAKTVKAISTMKDIDFKQMDNKSRIVIVLTEEPQFESLKISEKMIAVDIKNAFVPKHHQRVLNTSAFESAVNSIDIKNVKIGKRNDIRVLIKLKEEMPYEVTKEARTIFVDIERPRKVVTKLETVPPPKKEEVKAEVKEEAKEEVKVEAKVEVKEEVKKTEEKPAPPPIVTKPSEEGVIEKIYAGRRISLDFKDADIKNILRLIAEVSNFNIITADDVTGKITMRLVDVPWDQALDVILQARNLGMVQVGNVIRIAPVETLNRETHAKLETKRARERLEDMVTELIPINYATAKDIIPQIKGILSERGDVKVDERTNILIVKDIPRNIPAVKHMLKSLDTKTPQVLIEARIVEASVGFQRELGVSWGFETITQSKKGDTVSKQIIVGGGLDTPGTTPGTTIGTTLGSTTSKVVDLPAVAQAGIAGATGQAGVIEFLLTSIYGLRQLDIAISAHENKGDAKVVSSPKIATLHNKEASIEQGLRIPYRKLTTEGTITTDFIDANLKLTVTPLVTNDGNVKLTIKAKKDAPEWSRTVDGVPSIDKKEAITEVLVKDNGVVVIAGVYSIRTSEGVEGIPLLSKIPLLGWLFKREAKEDERRDLLIFISPKVIKDQI